MFEVKSATMTIPAQVTEMDVNKKDRSDGELILLTRGGRQDAFGVLVERYRANAVRLASSIVGDWELARDLSQDAFLKAYRALGSFDITSPFMPWFYRILRNTCMDQLRRKGRFRTVLEKITLTKSSRGDLREEISRSDLSAIVRKAIDCLKDKDREIIELRHFSGLSYDEMSELLDIPRGTVMSRLHYARRVLHDVLVNDFHVKAGDL
jgi:RNA polymerase sigma-70 factor, ECF subfamily